MREPDYCFVIRDKQGLYLSDSYYQMAWTVSLTKAKRFQSFIEANLATIKRAGKVHLLQLRDIVELEPSEIIGEVSE